MYSKNIVSNFGRAVYVGMFQAIEASGMTILSTEDSGNIVKIQKEDWTGTGKTLHFAGREPTDQGPMRWLYLDVTSSDFVGQGLDGRFRMAYFIEPGATGDMNVYYDSTGGEALAMTVDLTKRQGTWVNAEANINNMAFNGNLNGGDIRIEIPSAANVTILTAQVQERDTYSN